MLFLACSDDATDTAVCGCVWMRRKVWKSSLCVCVTFLICHWLDLPLLCTFSIKQQSVIRARQRTGGKNQYILPTCWGNWHSSSAVMVSHTANSYDIPTVCEKLTHQKIRTKSLCCSWVGGGGGGGVGGGGIPGWRGGRARNGQTTVPCGGHLWPIYNT